MTPDSPNCKKCHAPMELQQTCLNIFWRCHACKRQYPLEAFPQFIDDAMEERLANTRCNRI